MKYNLIVFMNYKEMKKIILNFINEYYGRSEKENPCYNITLLAKYILKNIDENVKVEKESD